MDERTSYGPKATGKPAGSHEELSALLGGRLYRAIGLLFVLALFFRYFDTLSRVVLLAFTGIIIGIVFNAIVARLPVSRAIGTAIIAVLTFGGIGISGYFLGNAIATQARAFIRDLPSIIESAEEWVGDMSESLGVDVELTGPRVQQMLQSVVGEVSGGTLIASTFGVLEVFAIGLLVLMGAFFVVAKPNDLLLTPLMRAVPRDRRPACRRILSLMGKRLSGWLVGTVVSMISIGILATVAFYILGVPYPLLLGIVNGLLNIIPLIGAWIGGLVVVVVTIFANPSMIVWVILTVIAIQELEGNVIRPLAMTGTARIHPFVTLLSLLLFGSMFGILGAILSIPITLAVFTLVEVLWVEETLGTANDEIEPLVKK